MGYEFIIILRDSDLETLSRDSRGTTTIHKLLQEIPCYKGMGESGQFFYSTDDDREVGWYSSIHVEGNKLLLCSYAGTDFRAITDFLFRRLLDLCGHFEIEDA